MFSRINGGKLYINNSLHLARKYARLLKTGSLDNAIREFSLAKPSWVMSHYTTLYKHGKRKRDLLGRFYFLFSFVCSIMGAFLIKQLFHSRLLDMR